MQHKHLRFGQGFHIVLGDQHSQAAQMTLVPGATEGGPDNRHQGADQWLYVVSGTGEALVHGERVELRGNAGADPAPRPARDQKHWLGTAQDIEYLCPAGLYRAGRGIARSAVVGTPS